MLSQAGDDDEEGDEGLAGLAELAAGAGGGMPVIELTPEDDAAIQRLQALGFDRNACVVSCIA